jgi:hypothetical protein
MPELERIVDAAVADAPTSDMTRVERVVARRRRRRALVTTTVIGALILAGAGYLLVPRDEATKVATTQNTAGPTTPSSLGGAADFSTADLQRELAALGHSVRVIEGQLTSSLLGTNPTRLCVDAHEVQVYEYASEAERVTWSGGISPDGGSIAHGNSRAEVLWIAPPHFFARGKVIALYVGSDERLIADLATLLGPTLDPDAPQAAGTREQPC